ncbi:aldo/keto reductase [Methanoplanus sp. FWC-SCC4]|uniref:Aldo/keto reductase n=1 Tax=Methanochimaera problematica TaxID=2609417 RepID=A0AA97FER6_9EURY|nr:aldo/keto reductase [Methanoplanus sp. FWC-SCC4]WOF17207.1 aldo/keto reductase [Methanoplanus sp. FWC-SCC4]
MLYRKIPKTGDELSILGYGCMRLPEKNKKIDWERAKKQIRSAIDNGVNYIDTAWPYHMGESESFLGEVLKDGYRDKVRLATKLPVWLVKNRDDADFFLNAQLIKLQTKTIDYYLLHNLDKNSWEKVKALGLTDFLDTAKRDGRIRYAGFSFHGDPDTFREIVDSYDWEFCQIQYNFLDIENQAGKQGLLYAAEKNLGVIIMEPLRGGALTRNVPAGIKEIWERADFGDTPAECALRWIWNHQEVTVVLSGMNEEEHIKENLNTASGSYPGILSNKDILLVEEVRKKYMELMKVPCTGCRYCMPCPSGVDIPSCFDIYNSYHLSGDRKSAQFMYLGRLAGVAGDKAGASLCTNCGKCLKNCPQHINIPKELKEVSAEFEGRLTALIVPFVKFYFEIKRRLKH